VQPRGALSAEKGNYRRDSIYERAESKTILAVVGETSDVTKKQCRDRTKASSCLYCTVLSVYILFTIT
jgi:hypothetical protein